MCPWIAPQFRCAATPVNQKFKRSLRPSNLTPRLDYQSDQVITPPPLQRHFFCYKPVRKWTFGFVLWGSDLCFSATRGRVLIISPPPPMDGNQLLACSLRNFSASWLNQPKPDQQAGRAPFPYQNMCVLNKYGRS